jgi:diaminopropionate ammonia-lyase
MAIQITRNRALAPHGSAVFEDVISPAGAQAARSEISTWPGYAATPLYDLAPVASACGVDHVFYKDEASRLGLGSFKALGGAYAVARLLQRRLQEQLGRPVAISELACGDHHAFTQGLTVVSATDGNHGRSVAAGAARFGCRCVILVHAHVSEGRKQAIEALGADVTRLAGDYDDTVREAARLAGQDGWSLVADTSSAGDEDACIDIMHGYTVMVAEAFDQLSQSLYGPPTHIFVQGGVGGLAAAVCAHAWQVFGAQGPIQVVVEPERADCLFQSAIASAPTRATGDLKTIMAGLSCGEVSALAWRVLERGAEFFMTIPDQAAIDAMRLLADKARAGTSIVAGESAGAGLAGLMAACADPGAKAELRLDRQSRVLVFGTEGATDPALYKALIAATAL